MRDADLVKHAIEACSRSYSPYSSFRVGAALLDGDGNVHIGTNIENASYGLTVCAERNALFRAVTDGVRHFKAMAVAVSRGPLALPCGACRQVMTEFCNNTFIIHCVSCDDTATVEHHVLGDLLPGAFRLEPADDRT